MADQTYDDLILGACIGSGDELRWRRLIHEGKPNYFLPGAHRDLYEIVSRYWRITQAPIDYPTFVAMLDSAGVDAARRLLLDTEFRRLWALEVVEPHFRFALREIRLKRRDERLGASLADGLRAMYEGIRGEQGYDVARKVLSEGLAEIDRHFEPTNPEGDIRLDAAAMHAEYEHAQLTGGFTERMVRTGLPEVDSRITGLRPGENMLVAAYSSHGKTTVIQNIAWSACVQEHKNVLIFTNENLYGQYRARLYSRHTHWAPGAVGVAGGLRYNDIKTGTLSGQDQLVWRRVIDDFGTNPDYGKLVVVQMPMGGSMQWVSDQLSRWHDEMDVGLCILDYIGRMGPITPRPTKRDELNDTLAMWKNVLVSFGAGAGVPGITGYQTSRQSMIEALSRGYYTLDCLAETSEAERNADVVMSLLFQEDVERELRIQLLKNRDGALLEPTSIVADFATTLVSGYQGWAA
jgi:replicative DNA helicase